MDGPRSSILYLKPGIQLKSFVLQVHILIPGTKIHHGTKNTRIKKFSKTFCIYGKNSRDILQIFPYKVLITLKCNYGCTIKMFFNAFSVITSVFLQSYQYFFKARIIQSTYINLDMRETICDTEKINACIGVGHPVSHTGNSAVELNIS